MHTSIESLPTRITAEQLRDVALRSGTLKAKLHANPGEIRNALTPRTGPAGGYLEGMTVDEAFELALADTAPLRQLCTVIRRPPGNEHTLPMADDRLNEGVVVAPNADAGEQDILFEAAKLRPLHWSSKRVRISNTLLRDWPRCAAQVGSILGARIARGQNRYFTTQLVRKAQVGATPVSNIVLNDITDLVASVPSEYRRNAVFMGTTTTWKLLIKMSGVEGEGLRPYLFGVHRGTDSDAWSFIVNDHMDEATTGKRPLLFGDFSRFVFADSEDYRIIASAERFAEFDQSSFEAVMNTDAVLVDAGSGPIRALQMA